MIVLFHIFVAAVIEDEARVRAGIDQFCPVVEFGRSHAEVEAQPEFTEQPDPRDKLFRKTVTRRGFVAVQYPANALDVWAIAKLRDVLLERLLVRPARKDAR